MNKKQRNKVVGILEISIYRSAMRLNLNRLGWDTTQCQDVLHSSYNAYTEIKNIMADFVVCEEVALEGEFALLKQVITSILRPFQIRWHSTFFRCTEGRYCQMYTKARRWAPIWRRRKFRREYMEVQDAVGDLLTQMKGNAVKNASPDSRESYLDSLHDTYVVFGEELFGDTMVFFHQAMKALDYDVPELTDEEWEYVRRPKDGDAKYWKSGNPKDNRQLYLNMLRSAYIRYGEETFIKMMPYFSYGLPHLTCEEWSYIKMSKNEQDGMMEPPEAPE